MFIYTCTTFSFFFVWTFDKRVIGRLEASCRCDFTAYFFGEYLSRTATSKLVIEQKGIGAYDRSLCNGSSSWLWLKVSLCAYKYALVFVCTYQDWHLAKRKKKQSHLTCSGVFILEEYDTTAAATATTTRLSRELTRCRQQGSRVALDLTYTVYVRARGERGKLLPRSSQSHAVNKIINPALLWWAATEWHIGRGRRRQV